MIKYIKGTYAMMLDNSIIVENTSGIGFEIFIPKGSPLYKYSEGDEIMVFTEMVVKEDDISLYGFHNKESLEMFKILTTVSGIGPKAIDKIYGVFKAYETRVGNGPMPSEFNAETEGELCDYVRNTGNEFGVTTGRPRRCGYLDLVALRYACHVNSIDNLVLTHIDIYDDMNEIEACVAYDIDGKIVTDFPASIPELNRAKPVLKKFTGWKKDITKCTSYDELPKGAKEYIEFIEDFTGTKCGIISVGADRNQTFVQGKIWE